MGASEIGAGRPTPPAPSSITRNVCNLIRIDSFLKKEEEEEESKKKDEKKKQKKKQKKKEKEEEKEEEEEEKMLFCFDLTARAGLFWHASLIPNVGVGAVATLSRH